MLSLCKIRPIIKAHGPHVSRSGNLAHFPCTWLYMSAYASLEIREIEASDQDLESFIRGQLNRDHSLRKLTSGGESGLDELIVQKVLAKAKGI